MKCPLCEEQTLLSPAGKSSFGGLIRSYIYCKTCGLTFTPKEQLPDRQQELNRYGTHNNQYSNIQYRQYQQSIIDQAAAAGVDFQAGPVLDYGGGRDQVLAKLLKEQGVNAWCYDPLYGITDLSEAPFAAVISCEAAEHFFDPQAEFEKIASIIKSSGQIYIQTRMTDRIDHFTSWWYINDVTHVVFYSSKTFQYLADRYNWTLELCDGQKEVLFRI